MKIVFTAAVMDLLHEGHINLLKKMREEAGKSGITIVVLHDGFTTFKNKRKLPIENLEKRTRNLIDTGLVDIILYTFDEEPIKQFEYIIDRFRYEEKLFIRGDDWKDFPGRKVLDDNSIDMEFVSYTKGVSSSKLRTEL